MKSNLDFALYYIEKGLKVFPCRIDKTPLTRNGFKNASLDETQIREWFASDEVSIGIPTGEASGWLVLDVDFPDGPNSLAALEMQYGPLPATMAQHTGSGSTHFFFRYPENVQIKNSASKLGPGLDIRAEGGYIIVPPSGHPSGGKYRWLTNGSVPLAEIPTWLLSLLTVKQDTPPPIRSNGGTSPYGRTALDNQAGIVACAANGTRNNALNIAAVKIGSLVAGGEIDQSEAESVLLMAATRAGLTDIEASKTLASGMKAGFASPNTARHDKHDKNDFNDKYDRGDKKGQKVTRHDSDMTNMTNAGSAYNNSDDNINLTAEVTEWVKESEGWFTGGQVDQQFALRSRTEKKIRSNILGSLVKEGVLKKDRQAKGRFCHIKQDIDFIDLEAVQEADFPVVLPLGLSDLVSLPSGVAVLAGSTNAGKTVLLLEMLRLNFHQEYPLMYLMSEMGPSEYKGRLRLFNLGFEPWQRVLAAPKASGQDQVIKYHNPNGLTMVDYIEECEGEYFKINSIIRDIYDAVGSGCAWIALQKRKNAEFGRGGEATMEKARLYLTLDIISADRASQICALKIQKAKCWRGEENPNGKEIHFRIIKGALIEPISGWMRCNAEERKGLVEAALRREAQRQHWTNRD